MIYVVRKTNKIHNYHIKTRLMRCEFVAYTFKIVSKFNVISSSHDLVS